MYSKTFSVLICIVLWTTNLAWSQSIVLPGGVENPMFWIKSTNQGEAYYWESLTTTKGKVSLKKQNGTMFNFNPSIVFDNSQDSLILPLGIETIRRQTVFLAYNVKDSLKEQFLWTMNDPEKPVTVATNKRLVDLKRYAYKTYQEKFKPRKANIHFFQQNITDSIAALSTLTIGQMSHGMILPPQEFKGNISEILVYNRVLSAKEVQKIASYLSIKYGISISQYEITNYLNSQGEVIWDIEKHKGFDASITGVGRDDGSGLLQRKSTNMYNEGLLTIALKSKSNEIPNNYFSFWSDNDKSLSVKRQEQGEPFGIAREWQLDFSNPTDLSLDWTFNPAFITGTLPKDTYYWLLVDYSGTGKYNNADSEYIRLASTSSKEKIILNDFNWDKQQTGTTKFTLRVAPEMFSTVGISEASCGIPGSGHLQYSIEGGEAPFTITVKKKDSDVVIKEWQQMARSTSGVALASGTYEYMVKDKKGNQYAETIFVADKDGTLSPLLSDYTLVDGQALVLDASTNLPVGEYQYEWYYEGAFQNSNPEIRINQPGNYELHITNAQQCKTRKKITVDTDGNEIADNSVMILYPNPTSNGKFAIAMEFPEKTDASITIHSTSGSLIKEKRYSQIQTYLHEDRIEGVSGEYLVKVNSAFGIKIFKVILK